LGFFGRAAAAQADAAEKAQGCRGAGGRIALSDPCPGAARHALIPVPVSIAGPAKGCGL
jgi:hypothetical protein